MAKIDIDKFIISLCENGFGTLGMGDIRNALREQGLKYEKGELLEFNKELKLTEFEKAVQSVLYTEITNAVNNDPYVLTADKIKQASKMLLDKARKYYNEKNLEVELGLLNEFSHVDYWTHKGSSKSDKELEGEGPKLQVVDFDRQLQWEKEKIINKACEWLREHKDYVATEDNGISGWIPERFIEDFKEYMNENS